MIKDVVFSAFEEVVIACWMIKSDHQLVIELDSLMMLIGLLELSKCVEIIRTLPSSSFFCLAIFSTAQFVEIHFYWLIASFANWFYMIDRVKFIYN